ncbi:MAG: heavy metal translocating P-type ATPase [Gammaproteobacteria bacterium]
MADERTCYHCGLPVPAGLDLTARIDGTDRPMCCHGCKAVAELISGSGLDAYYRFREEPPGELPAVTPGDDGHWRGFDDPETLPLFTAARPDGLREAVLHVEGLYCSACSWLLENVLGRLPGIEEITVNTASSRLHVVWRPDETRFSAILGTVERLGYRPHPRSLGESRSPRDHERRQALKRLLVAGIGMMQVMMFAIGLYAGAFQGIEPEMRRFLVWVSLIVTTPVVLYAGRPFFQSAWRGLRSGRPGMDLPVSIAIGSAYAASVYATVSGHGEVYFDSATMFIFFLSLGRFLEMNARHRATERSAAIGQLLPDTVRRLIGDEEEIVAVVRLRSGDRFRLRPGERVPADARIVSGRAAVDESLVTGESRPVAKEPGDTVTAGSINLDGALTLTAERVGQDTLLAAIGRLLERAQAERPAIAVLADRVASWFVVGVLAIAAAVALTWWWLEPAAAFPTALAVLVVTCPCALSLATPAALAAANTALADRGILVVRSRALEGLSRFDRVVFDKTGTLTRGRPELTRIHVLTGAGTADAEAYLAIAARLESGSEHAVARAFPRRSDPAEELRPVPGRGMEGSIGGTRYRVGSAEFVGTGALAALPALDADRAATLVFLGTDDGRGLAAFELRDQPREDAARVVAALHEAGITSAIASGDRPETVRDIAAALGVDDARGALSPEDKLDWVRAMQSAGETVALVGDGINDAPVLAGADVSIAMGAGTTLAQSSADAVLLGESLTPLLTAVDVARRTRRIIRQNIGWAIGYNLLAVPLAASGTLAPWMAAIGMSASSLLVVLNALRLRRGTGRSRGIDEGMRGDEAATRPEILEASP